MRLSAKVRRNIKAITAEGKPNVRHRFYYSIHRTTFGGATVQIKSGGAIIRIIQFLEAAQAVLWVRSVSKLQR